MLVLVDLECRRLRYVSDVLLSLCLYQKHGELFESF